MPNMRADSSAKEAEMKGKLRIKKRHSGMARVNCSIEDESGRILAQSFAVSREDELELKRLACFPEVLDALKSLLSEMQMPEYTRKGRRAIRARRVNAAWKIFAKARGKG
jgi:hypothetical protein